MTILMNLIPFAFGVIVGIWVGIILEKRKNGEL